MAFALFPTTNEVPLVPCTWTPGVATKPQSGERPNQIRISPHKRGSHQRPPKGFPPIEATPPFDSGDLPTVIAPRCRGTGTECWQIGLVRNFSQNLLHPGSAPASRILQQKPGPQFYLFDNRRLLGAAPHPSMKCNKSLVRSCSSLTKHIRLVLPRSWFLH